MKLYWNFLERGGGGGGGEECKTKKLPLGEYGYFLELHIIYLMYLLLGKDT